MKRAVLVIAGVALLLFGAVKLMKLRQERDHQAAGARVSNAARSRTASFWNLYYQATEKRTSGDFEQAAELYRRALELRPGHEESLYYLANCLYELGEYAGAVKLYESITRANGQSQRAFSQLGVVLSISEPGGLLDWEEARRSLERSSALNREESGSFLKLGLLALNQGHLDEALTHFETAAGFRSPEGTYLAGLTLYQQGKDREASRRFIEVLEQNAREKQISGRGVFSEGDVAHSTGAMTALEAAGVKSLLFLYWTACRSGGYPAAVPLQFRIHLAPGGSSSHHFVPLFLEKESGRGSWSDYDRDGDPDLASAVADRVRLLRNDKGVLHDVSGQLGVAASGPSWDTAWGDVDGDEYPDLYVIRSGFLKTGSNTLYLNQEGHGFKDVTEASGLAGSRATAGAVFLDYDRDGKIDLLEVGNKSGASLPVRLYRNTGGSRFTEVTEKAGLSVEGNAVDCSVADFNRDGWADLLVTRWKRPPLLFQGSSAHRFSEVAEKSGLKAGRRYSFSSLFFDYNRDGLPDIFLSGAAPMEKTAYSLIRQLSPKSALGADTSAPYANRLFRNRGDGTFEEVTEKVGLHEASGVMQAVAGDFDGDGWTDLALSNGALEAGRVEPSLVLQNRGGREFAPLEYLPGVGQPDRSIGVSVADINRDGRDDIYLAGIGLFQARPSTDVARR